MERSISGVAELATSVALAVIALVTVPCTYAVAETDRDGDAPKARPPTANVLLATRASLDGAGREEVAAVLEETEASALAGDDAALASAHRWFVSCDSDSVPASVHDLVDLGRLLEA